MIKSILVPLDGSQFGEHALPMALSIARQSGASIQLLHVIQPFVEVVPELAAYPLLEAEVRKEKQTYLDGVVNRARESSAVPMTTELFEGEIAATIRAAAEKTTNLVVMTTHGRGPVARFWLGSVADRLVREMKTPLLLVHPSGEKADFRAEPALRHILLPLDGTPLAEHVIPTAADLAQSMDAELTLFRVVHTTLPQDFDVRYRGTFATDQIRQMAEDLRLLQEKQKMEAEHYLRGVADRVRSRGVRTRVKVVLDEAPAQAILKETANGVDAIALATHGRGGLKRLWLGSVADKIIRGSAVPILVQRPEE